MEWGTLSTTTPLVSATTEDRPPLEVRFVNESSAHLTVSWVDAAGRLRHGRRCAPGAGPLRVRDGSVRPPLTDGPGSRCTTVLSSKRCTTLPSSAGRHHSAQREV